MDGIYWVLKKNFKTFLVIWYVRQKKEFNIILNGNSLEFDYTLPGYIFPEISKEFTFEHNGETKIGNVKFNLSLMQNNDQIQNCPLDSVVIVSDVKVCNLTLDNESLIKEVYESISKETGKKNKSTKVS